MCSGHTASDGNVTLYALVKVVPHGVTPSLYGTFDYGRGGLLLEFHLSPDSVLTHGMVLGDWLEKGSVYESHVTGCGIQLALEPFCGFVCTCAQECIEATSCYQVFFSM